MTLDDFLAEAQRLQRLCTYLEAAGVGEPIAGYWHGTAANSLCISVEHEGRWLNVFLDADGRDGRVVESPEPEKSRLALKRRAAQSLPPVEAVFLHGSALIGNYLKTQGWERDWGFNDNFKDEVPHHYEKLWQDQNPMYGQDVVAVEGGWPFPWPDDDGEGLATKELVLCTFRDSEPWVEVLRDNDGYQVIQRIT